MIDKVKANLQASLDRKEAALGVDLPSNVPAIAEHVYGEATPTSHPRTDT